MRAVRVVFDRATPRMRPAPGLPPWLGVGVCAVLWGSAFPVIKLIYAHWAQQGVQPDFALRSLFSGVRFVVAGGALLIWARRPLAELGATGWKWVLAMALTQTVGQYVLFYWGLEMSSGALAALLISSGSFWWVLLAPRLGHSPPMTARQWWVLSAGAAGVTLAVYSPGATAGNPQLGAIAILGANLFGALGLACFQKIKVTMGARAGTGFSLFIGGVMLCLLGVPAGLRGDLSLFDGYVIAATAWLAFVSAAAFAWWNHLSTLMPAHSLATYRFLIPICGVLESLVLLAEERLTPAMIVGGFVVCGAMLLVSRRPTHP
jgi:drug/metabolite transporter (DMT)-like permease